MKLSIEISKSMLVEIDELAARLNLSRNDILEKAIASFVNVHQPNETTRALDEVYVTESSKLDPILWEMQINSLPIEKW